MNRLIDEVYNYSYRYKHEISRLTSMLNATNNHSERKSLTKRIKQIENANQWENIAKDLIDVFKRHRKDIKFGDPLQIEDNILVLPFIIDEVVKHIFLKPHLDDGFYKILGSNTLENKGVLIKTLNNIDDLIYCKY